jgi:hypothetical protein
MSDLIGGRVRDPNFQFRILFIVSVGVLLLGVILFWREQLFLAADYQPMPTTHLQIKIIDQNRAKQAAE